MGVDPKWVEISWDEALDTIAEKLKKIRGADTIKLAEARGTASIRNEGWWAFLARFWAYPSHSGEGALPTAVKLNMHLVIESMVGRMCSLISTIVTTW